MIYFQISLFGQTIVWRYVDTLLWLQQLAYIEQLALTIYNIKERGQGM